MKRLQPIAALFVLLSACSARPSAIHESRGLSGGARGTLSLEVVNGTDTSLEVENASILVFASDMSLKEIGRTDVYGDARIDKNDLAASPVPILVVCKTPPFGCAAEPFEPLGLLRFDEFVIALPPMVVH